MANTSVTRSLEQYESRWHAEYVRDSRFRPYMNSSSNAIIQVNEKLTTGNRGDRVYINLIGALDAAAGPNDGSTALVGNEKALPNDAMPIDTKVVRDATVVNVEQETASPFDIYEAGRQQLQTLARRYLKLDIITAMGSIDGVDYGTATEGQKDTWLTNNADRVLFGDAKSIATPGDHSASLGAITTSMTLTKDVVSLAKRMAQTAQTVNGDGITPYMASRERETFVLFCDSLAFRDFRASLGSDLQQARERAASNPLFYGPTSLEWDGVMVQEIPEIASLGGVGSASAAVSPYYLCGQQALGCAWSRRTRMTRRKEDDYEFERGVGFMEIRKCEKMRYGVVAGTAPVDWGMLTGYIGAAADA